MKYTWEFKLNCVEEYLKGKYVKKPEYANCSDETFKSKIRIWVRLYKIYGIDGLKQKVTNKDWSAEERFELVAKVLAGQPNQTTAIEAGISDGQLYQWVRNYKLYGYDGLKLKKGRKPKGPVMSKDDKPKNLTKSEKEELIILRRQNEYLRAENAYLKKLRALIVQRRTESSVKAKKQPLLEDSEKKDID